MERSGIAVRCGALLALPALLRIRRLSLKHLIDLSSETRVVLDLFIAVNAELHDVSNRLRIAVPLQSITHTARRQEVLNRAATALCDGLHVIRYPSLTQRPTAYVT